MENTVDLRRGGQGSYLSESKINTYGNCGIPQRAVKCMHF